MNKNKFGLLGKTLKHSYSKVIHKKLGDYEYNLIELLPDKFEDFVKANEYAGYNVTIPYKKDIMPYLDVIDSSAEDIGAVNTVVKRGDKLYGYNTDFNGMKYTVLRAGIEVSGKVVAILGTGGTSNTAKAVFKSLGARLILTVSRSGEINYDNVYERQDVEIIVNTTPVGMYPLTDNSPIDLSKFSKLVGVVDVVYNPFITKLIYQANSLGIKCADGLPMLVAQAKFASELFNDIKISDSVIEKVIADLRSEKLNIVLVGMPGSGKSTVGRQIAKQLGREFIDTDKEIERRIGMSIPEYFEKYGETEFRKVEKTVCAEVGANNGKIIATGGGVVKDFANKFFLKQNGRIYYLCRSIDKLCMEGRPLSKDRDAVKKLYDERKDAYEFFADKKVDNNGEIDSTVKGVLEDYENFSH